MGVEVTLADISNGQQITSAATAVNTNSDTITTAFENVLSTSATTLSNSMNTNLDMNSNQILNLPAPATLNSPARLVDVTGTPTISVPTVGTSGGTVPLLNANNTWSGTQTYTVSPVISTITNTGTLTLPTSTDTLVGRATTDTLTNKTLTSPVIGTIVNTGTLTLPTSTDTLVGRATTDTLTNKTLTSPTISGSGSLTAASLSISGNSTLTGTLASGALTVTGNESISGLLNTGGFAKLVSNFPATSNTTLANITGLTVSLTTGNNYIFEVFLAFPSSGNNNNKVAIAGSATASTFLVDGIYNEGNGGINDIIQGTSLPATVYSTNTGSSQTGNMHLKGYIVCSGTGTLTVQFAQAATSGTTSTVLAGSHMKVFQVT